MQDITRFLPRDRVIDLWTRALSKAFASLAESHAKSPNVIPLLSCHLTLYSYRRSETYIAASASALMGPDATGPSHILLLIDDVYDMFDRLTQPTEVFDLVDHLQYHHADVWRGEGKSGTPRYSDPLSRRLDLEVHVEILSLLMTWRRNDMVLAERLATELAAHFVVAGTKQLISAVSAWLTSTPPTTVYLSHPISRPRREWRNNVAKGRPPAGGWPQVVHEFNRLQAALAGHDVFAVMPTAIDELRIGRSVGRPIAHRTQYLAQRWPPIDTRDDTLVYSPLPGAAPEFEHGVLGPVESHDVAINTVLRVFENQIKWDIPFRDHLLVFTCHHLLVFRPLYSSGEFSSGVEAEIEHWLDLLRAGDTKRAENTSRTRPVTPPDGRRRAVFFHHTDDIRVAASTRGEDHRNLWSLVYAAGQLAGLSHRTIDKHIEDYVPHMLDRPGPGSSGLRTIAKVVRDSAVTTWFRRLTNFDREGISAYVIVSPDPVDGAVDGIARFLRGSAVAATAGRLSSRRSLVSNWRSGR